MKLVIHVKPNSKKESIEKLSDTEWVVRVNTPPVDGAANERVVELISEDLDRPKSRIQLIRGQRSKIKLFEID
jgi:uncharacterized protein (TIGR00251 family)